MMMVADYLHLNRPVRDYLGGVFQVFKSPLDWIQSGECHHALLTVL